MVTPSFVIVGAPNFLSSTTLRPLGPIVTRTALASVSNPLLRETRDCCSNCNRFATNHTPLIETAQGTADAINRVPTIRATVCPLGINCQMGAIDRVDEDPEEIQTIPQFLECRSRGELSTLHLR